jgi:polyhydroxybutyrate depolymerase
MKYLIALLALVATPCFAEDYTEYLFSGGLERRYVVHTPPDYDWLDCKECLPVVFVLHGGGGNIESCRVQTQMDVTADKHGFIAVYPEGTSEGLAHFLRMYIWQAKKDDPDDDVKFISRVLDDLPKKYKIDKSRIYCTGMSLGAMMTYKLGMNLSGRFAAICAVACTKDVDQPKPTRPVPLLHIHGLQDKNCPVAGGIGTNAIDKMNHESVKDTIVWWCNASGLDPRIRSHEFFGQYIGTRFDNGRQNFPAPIEVYLLRDGGHTWPGGVDVTSGDGTGPVSMFPANEAMVRFFARFKL